MVQNCWRSSSLAITKIPEEKRPALSLVSLFIPDPVILGSLRAPTNFLKGPCYQFGLELYWDKIPMQNPKSDGSAHFLY